MCIYYDAGDVARQMEAHCPEPARKRNDAPTYYELANIWCHDIQRCVWSL